MFEQDNIRLWCKKSEEKFDDTQHGGYDDFPASKCWVLVKQRTQYCFEHSELNNEETHPRKLREDEFWKYQMQWSNVM